jgi:hypothetical protein
MPRAKQAEGNRVHFWCPGCDEAHGIVHEGPNAWGWNGDLDRPTFTPSVLVRGVQWGPESGFHRPSHAVEPGRTTVCHSFVTDGRIQFLGDCTHQLAGQTVDLPDWPYGDD